MVKPQLPKLVLRVRFPLSAPAGIAGAQTPSTVMWAAFFIMCFHALSTEGIGQSPEKYKSPHRAKTKLLYFPFRYGTIFIVGNSGCARREVPLLRCFYCASTAPYLLIFVEAFFDSKNARMRTQGSSSSTLFLLRIDIFDILFMRFCAFGQEGTV